MSRALNWFDKLMTAITFAEADAYECCLESGTGKPGTRREHKDHHTPNPAVRMRPAKARG